MSNITTPRIYSFPKAIILSIIVFSILSFANNAPAKIYMSQDEFLRIIKSTNSSPMITNFQNKTLWLNKDIQSHIKQILDHNYPKLRLRYKTDEKINFYPNHTTVWFLDEIGKERPITFGVAIKNNKIQVIRVLEFRESRGYEIKIPAFVKQFEQIGLNDENRLDHNIDGITGATMSVSAMKKIAKVALLLHEIISAPSKLNKKK